MALIWATLIYWSIILIIFSSRQINNELFLDLGRPSEETIVIIFSATGSEKIFFLWSSFSRVLVLWDMRLTWFWQIYPVFFENNSMACWERIMTREWLSFVWYYSHSMLWANQWNDLRGEWCKSDMKQWWDDVNINTITRAVSDDNGESSWQQCSEFVFCFVCNKVRTYH